MALIPSRGSTVTSVATVRNSFGPTLEMIVAFKKGREFSLPGSKDLREADRQTR